MRHLEKVKVTKAQEYKNLKLLVKKMRADNGLIMSGPHPTHSCYLAHSLCSHFLALMLSQDLALMHTWTLNFPYNASTFIKEAISYGFEILE